MAEDDKAQGKRARDRERFWSRIYIPVNEDFETNGAEFVNAIQVADMFAEATGISTKLAQEAEEITEQLANIDFQRTQMDRKVTRLRRTVLADAFAKIKGSWSVELVDAFVLATADEAQRLTLTDYENTLDELSDQKGVLVPNLDQLNKRMKVLEKNMDWAKQFLDFDKLMQRITTHGRNV